MKNKIVTLTLFAFFINVSFGQINISEFIQKSNSATTESNKLYFVDFWATWCGPCVTAKEHLGVLQKQFSKDFYVVSMSQENPQKIEKYLTKRPTDLAIAIDYYGETFKKYNIQSLPKGILFNAEGKVLWKGHTADLKTNIITEYLKQNKSRSTLKEFFNIVEITKTDKEDYIPKEFIEINKINESFEDLQIVENINYLKLSGSFTDIVSYLSKIYKKQLEIDDELNLNYEVYLKKPLKSNENIAYKLITEMGLSFSRKEAIGEVIEFKISEPNFWDTDQIDWGVNNPRYLIGDDQILADNVSLKDIAYKLSYVMDIPIIIPDNPALILKLHDWEIHYKFFQLMQNNLEDSYGIIAEKKEKEYSIYSIKKAP